MGHYILPLNKTIAAALAACLIIASCTGKGGRLGYRDVLPPSQQAESRAEEPVFENRPFDPSKVVTDPATGFEIVSDEILVTFKPGATAKEAETAVESVGGKLVGFNSTLNLYEIELPPGLTPGEAREKIADQPVVDQAFPNGIAKSDQTDTQSTCGWPDGFPNDPVFRDCDTKNDWGYAKIDAAPAWKTTAITTDTVIAVIDTGVDASHPEFAGRVLPGRDFIYGSSNTNDRHGHGTHVAGIAAARGNNEKGMAGGCWECKILPVKVLGDGGGGTWIAVLNGIAWAAQQGAEVLNMSLGGGRSEELYKIMEEAIASARKSGSLSVVAAGNSATDSYYMLPAAAPSAVTVAATDASDQRASFSNFGAGIDVSAPGVQIWAPVPESSYLAGRCNPAGSAGEKYCYLSGTSMASPMVAGAVGCILSRQAAQTLDEAESLLKGTADPIQTDKPLGAGRLNLGKACQPSGNKPPIAALQADPTSVQPLAVSTITAQASDPDGDPLSYAWSASGGTFTGSGAAITWTAPSKVGAYTITVKVSDTHFTVPASVIISVKTGEVYSLVIMPGNLLSSAKGETYQFRWRIEDEIGQVLNETPTWTVAGGIGSITVGGLFTAEKPGKGQVIAEFKGAVTNAGVEVLNRLPTCYASATPTKGHIPLEVQFAGSAFDPDGSIPSDEWNFGDESSSTQASARHTYLKSGSFKATFTATDPDGGSCEKTLTITAEPPNVAPTCKASASPAKGKATLKVQFSPSAQDSDGTVVSYLWKFHNGSIQTQAQAGFTYANAGTYSVALTVKDDDGATCQDETSVVILPPNVPPSVVISVNPSFGDEPLPVLLSATAWDSDGKIASYTWTTGDGGASSQPSFTYTYKQDGTYTAQVTVTDDDGATATAKASVTVKQVIRPPTCAVEAKPTQGKAPLSVSLTGKAADTDGSITSTLWTFGDGTSSNNASTTHLYSKAGTYPAGFKATDNDGATCHASAQIEVRPPNQPPKLALKATPSSGNEPLTVTFQSGASDADGAVVKYSWAFGDGETSSEVNPTHIYINDGKYTAAVTVTDNDGASATASTVIRVDRVFLPISCTASAAPDWGSAPLPTQFTARVTDPGGDMLASDWNFGDGQFSSLLGPAHTYTINGTFEARFHLRAACAARHIASGSGHTCAVMTDGTVRCWGSNRFGQLGDGTTIDRPVPVAVLGLGDVVELHAGIDRTCAVLQDETVRCWGNLGNKDGAAAETSLVPTVAPALPAENLDMSFSHSCSVLPDRTVTCVGRNTFGQLGDGTTIDRTDPAPVAALQDVVKVSLGEEHSCALLGGGSVLCWGSNSTGQLGIGAPGPGAIGTHPEPVAISICTACSKRVPISVNPSRPPNCSASASPLSGPVPLGVSFSAQGTDPEGETVSFNWSFGDGGSATGSTPGHTFASAGTFTARLTAVDPQGAKCIKDVPIQANPNQPPTCSGSINPTRGPAPLNVVFTGNAADTDGSIVSSYWNLGNGSTLAAAGTYTYTQSGAYHPVFTAKDSSGADCSTNFSLRVDAKPVCATSATPTQGRVPLTVSLGGSATDSDGFVAAGAWNYGDGSTGAGFSSHTFSSFGQYTATFTATDNDGYACSQSQTITVLPPNKPPTCSTSVSPAKAHAPATIQFYAAASDPDGSVARYLWEFGDGAASSSQNPSHVYSSAGTFTANLTVTDNENATCSSSQTVAIEPPNKPPTVSIKATPSKGPEPLTVAFSAAASDPDGQVVTFNWTFGDGATSSSANPQHVYGQDGTYTAQLTVKDDDGATASASTVITADKVLIPPSCAASGSPLKGHQPLNVSLSGSASDPDGSIAASKWAFGDGSESTSTQVSHTYSSQGAYTAKFTATDNDGVPCSASVSITVEPPNKPPVALFSATPTSGYEPLTVPFDAGKSSDSDGAVVSYAWTFGDGAEGVGVAPNHTFAKWGTYTVHLVVTDDDGATASAETRIQVWEGDYGSPDAWPMFGGKGQHDNFSPSALPAKLELVTTLWPAGSGGGLGGQELNIPILAPAVSAGLLFITTAGNLHTFDAFTGKSLWNLSVPYGSDDPTPAVGEGVIVFTTGNELHAYELATGRKLWTQSLPNCSDSTSPTIAQGAVFITDCVGEFTGYALHTGKPLLVGWLYEGKVATPHGSPTVYDGWAWAMGSVAGNSKTLFLAWRATGEATQGKVFYVPAIVQSAPAAKYKTVYAADLAGTLWAYDSDTLALRWSFKAGGGFSTTPAVVHGNLIIGSWDHNVYALDAFTGKLLWTAPTDGEIRSNAAVTPTQTVVVSRKGTVYRFNLSDGSLIDSYPLGVESWASPAIAHGMIYVGATDGKIYVLGDPAKLPLLTRTWTSSGGDPGRTGSAALLGPTLGGSQFTFATGGGVNGSAAVNEDGDIHFGTSSGIFYALRRDGTVKWSYSTGTIRGSPTLDAAGNVMAASYGGVVYKFDPTGRLLWSYWLANTIQATPCAGPDGSAYVGDTAGHFFGISPGGSLKFKASVGDAVRNACAVDPAGNVYVGGGDNHLRKFSPNGSLLFDRGLNGTVLSSPTVAEDGTAFVSTSSGNTFAISAIGSVSFSIAQAGSVSLNADRLFLQTSQGLYAYTRSGQYLWGFSAGSGCSGLLPESPLVDADGNIFFKQRFGCAGTSSIYAIDSSGRFLWNASVEGGSDSSPSLGRGRALYIGSNSGLHIFGEN